MEDQTKLMESLLEGGAEYARKSFELAKLKAVDKIADLISSALPRIIVFLLILLVAVFVSVGLALWLGGILGAMYLGFFLVAVLYGVTGTVFHFFTRMWLKKIVGDYFVTQMLK